MTFRRATLVLSLCGGAAACALFRPGPVAYPTGLRFPATVESSVKLSGRLNPGLALAGGLLYMTTEEGKLAAVDVSSRQVAWEFRPGAPIPAPPSAGVDRVYIRDSAGAVYSLDVRGRLLWKTAFGEQLTAGPVELGMNVYVGTQGGRLLALDPELHGQVVWEFQAGSAITTAPAATPDGFLFGTAAGGVPFLDASGKVRWTFAAQGPVVVPPLADEGLVFVGDETGHIYALSTSRGKPEWKRVLNGRTRGGLVVAGRRLLVPTSSGVLYCLDKKNGTVLWWQETPNRFGHAPLIVEDRVVAASEAPALVAYKLKNGERVGSYGAGQDIRATPLWNDPHLLVALTDPKTGESKLVFLGAEVGVSLEADKASPQPAGAEVVFAAKAVGFFRPRFEFFLQSGETKTVVQKESDRGRWTWFPEKAGTFKVGVRVADEKQTREAELPFVIQDKTDQAGAAGPKEVKK
ncbi:MAG: PQQ-binding-like beta-propeller repeat protein [Candidatus Aminicenantes bacterium]|nr:PQQ-binding-like beta-propeller repeat protein [Candidatus Aminicenantes bacterium]